MTVGVNTAWKAKTSQPKATPWEQSATNIRPERAKELLFRALPLPLCSVGLLFFCPLRGRYPCCILSPRALPGAGISMPLRGVGSLTFRRICYPPESNIRIFNPQYPSVQPPRKRGVEAVPKGGGKATVRS